MTLALGSQTDFWSSKLHSDFLSACRSSDFPLLPAYVQCVPVTVLLLPLAPRLLVLAVSMAENAGPLSCGLCHMCCCARHARLFGSARRLLLHMLSRTLPLQMAFLAPTDRMFFRFLLMCVQPPHAVPMKYMLFISSAVQLRRFRSREAINGTTASAILNATCSFPGMLILLPLGSVEVSTCSVFNPTVTNFGYLTTRHPSSVEGGALDIPPRQASEIGEQIHLSQMTFVSLPIDTEEA